MKRVNVEVWSDFVCPWCWIAKSRLEKAAKALEGRFEVVVSHKAYRLARGMAPEDFKNALYKKFGSKVAAEGMMKAVTESAEKEGLNYNFDTMRFGDTTDAHILIKAAGAEHDKLRLIERVFSAGTTEGLDIFDRNVLRGLAEEVGVPADSIDFNDPEAVSNIAREEMEAIRVANGVPLFVFNGKLYLSGAREVAVFEKALQQVAVDVPDAIDDADAASCGIDGCRI